MGAPSPQSFRSARFVNAKGEVTSSVTFDEPVTSVYRALALLKRAEKPS